MTEEKPEIIMAELRMKFLQWFKDYAEGKITSEEQIDKAYKFLRLEQQNRNLTRLTEQGNKSLALRLIRFLPNDDEMKKKYIQMTNPELQPLLIEKPEKEK